MSDPFVLPASEQWTTSSETGETGLRVTLAYPSGGAEGEVPVVFLLDGDFLFLTATEFVRTLHLVTMGDFPQVAVVGVMRDEPDPLRYITTRLRDFTPHEWTLTGPFADDNAMAWMGTGGAPSLLRTLEHDVMPEVARRLRARDCRVGEVAVGGWSLSGLFACWAWMERPDLFDHVLSISPSLWWNDAALLDAEYTNRPADNRVFVCAGEHEEGDLERVYPRRFANEQQRDMAAMVTNAVRFAERVRGSGATVDHVTFLDEHHVTVQTAAIARGLRHIFG